MLMFGSANVAEEVCHLNRWDKCSLPINALETALELRQLDTLAFFLRSRDTGMAQNYLVMNGLRHQFLQYIFILLGEGPVYNLFG